MDELLLKIEALKTDVQALALEKYNTGFADGVKAAPAVDPGVEVDPATAKIYSQVEMDATVADMKQQIIDLKILVDQIKNEMSAKMTEMIVSLKSKLLEAYEAKQVVETGAETGFKGIIESI